MDRRNKVINEALAEEVRRGEQRKKRSDSAAAVPETEPAAPEPIENPIEPEANPKRRLLMKSASLTASGRGQRKDKRSIPDDESRKQVEDTSETVTGEGAALLAASLANTWRRLVVRSEFVAVTTQEAVDGHCEKAIRNASVEQIELGNIMELSITGQVLRWARQTNLSGLSLCKADGWNLKNHNYLTVARHLREKTHRSMLVVTIRGGEERGTCSAVLRELVRIVKDQIEERGVAFLVTNRVGNLEKASLKIVRRENQLKYVYVEEMRVITNNRCIAEQINHDKAENVVMDGSKV